MRKIYVVLIYVAFILLGSIGITTLVWNDIKGKTIDTQYYETYLNIKDELLSNEAQAQYKEDSDAIDVVVNIYESNDSYLVSTVFSNPLANYKNLVILVIDESELTNKTNKVYPSVGIVGNFENEFVVNTPNQTTTHSKITMNYENDTISEGVLVYLKYVSNNTTCVEYLNVSVK